MIEGLDNIAASARLLRHADQVHHCAMDRATGTQFMNIMHDLTPRSAIPAGARPGWSNALRPGHAPAAPTSTCGASRGRYST